MRMVSTDNGKCTSEIEEEFGMPTMASGSETKDQITLDSSSSQRMLLDMKSRSIKLLDRVKALRFLFQWMKFGSSSSSSPSNSQHKEERRDDILRPVPSLVNKSFSSRLHVPSMKKINWQSLWELFKKWIRDPLNMALFIWIFLVAVSGANLFLVMTGMLNGVLHTKSQRDTWFEVNNQIINALFTLMCLYQHPRRFYHLSLLYRWKQDDVQELQKVYCKNGTYKPNERKHMLVVVILLHVNCFAQYALCGLNLGYHRSERPAIGVGLCLCVALISPAVAGVYSILSPLGKEYEAELDQEAQCQTDSTIDSMQSHEKRYSFVTREDHMVAETSPQWVGGIFDFWDDISLAYLSFFCSCCVFGWNMDRLGFGNMYVHVATFLLFCLAPLFIFNLAAVNIDNEAVREALGIIGFLLAFFGLLYGGFWRIQMRKKFKLPASTFCCGEPSVTDCFQWLFCCSCSLAQEVRTADYYDVVEDKLIQPGLSPLPREAGTAVFTAIPSSTFQDKSNQSLNQIAQPRSPSKFSGAFDSHSHTLTIKEDS